MNLSNAMLVAFVVAIALGFFLSGMEAGLFALSRLRLRQQQRAGSHAARLLNGYLENPENFLWTILVGNTLANCLVVGLIVHRLHVWLGRHPWLMLLALIPALFALYALADLLPKMLFRQVPTRLCLALARPFRVIHLALAPLVVLVSWLAELLLRLTGGRRFTGRLFGNRDELRLLMQESGQDLTTEERAMVNRVLDLQHVTVGAIATPLTRAVTASTQTPLGEVFRLCAARGLSRLPLREPSTGRITGILSLRNSLYRDDLDPSRTAGAFLQPALYLEESMRLETALQRLRQTGQRLAIVLNRDRREVGTLALDDILRFLFGEVNL